MSQPKISKTAARRIPQSSYSGLNDGRICHSDDFRQKLFCSVAVVENGTPFLQNKSETDDSYFKSLLLTMTGNRMTRVESKALLSYLHLLTMKKIKVLATVLIEAFQIDSPEKLPDPSTIRVLHGYSSDEDSNKSIELFPKKKWKVVKCKKKTFKQRLKKKTTIWVGRAMRFEAIIDKDPEDARSAEFTRVAHILYEWTTQSEWGLCIEPLDSFKQAQLKSDKEMRRLLTVMEKEGERNRLYNLSNALSVTHMHISKDGRFIAAKKEGLRKALDNLETITLEKFNRESVVLGDDCCLTWLGEDGPSKFRHDIESAAYYLNVELYGKRGCHGLGSQYTYETASSADDEPQPPPKKRTKKRTKKSLPRK